MKGLEPEEGRPLLVGVVPTAEASSALAASIRCLLGEGCVGSDRWEIAQGEVSAADVLVLVGGVSGAAEVIRGWRAGGGRASSSSPGAGAAGALLISAVQGLRLAELRALAGPGSTCCRATVGLETLSDADVILAALEPEVPRKRSELCLDLLGRLGEVEVVSEETLETAEALAAVVPALLCEALTGMEEGAAEAGLPLEITRPFLRQTLLATALLLERDQVSPAELKDQVASPGGTTIAGLAVLEEGAVRGAFLRAVEEVAAGRGK
jgi:pyrroline-5-carboxylate reductase